MSAQHDMVHACVIKIKGVARQCTKHNVLAKEPIVSGLYSIDNELTIISIYFAKLILLFLVKVKNMYKFATMLRLKVENIIKNHGLSVTKARKRVLKCFLNLDKPISLKTIRSSIEPIDRITLFRILSSFESKGIIHSIRLDNSPILYALCKNTCSDGNHNRNHIHFQCESCDDVSCLFIDNFPAISLPDYKFNNININVSGICQTCSS